MPDGALNDLQRQADEAERLRASILQRADDLAKTLIDELRLVGGDSIVLRTSAGQATITCDEEAFRKTGNLGDGTYHRVLTISLKERAALASIGLTSVSSRGYLAGPGGLVPRIGNRYPAGDDAAAFFVRHYPEISALFRQGVAERLARTLDPSLAETLALAQRFQALAAEHGVAWIGAHEATLGTVPTAVSVKATATLVPIDARQLRDVGAIGLATLEEHAHHIAEGTLVVHGTPLDQENARLYAREFLRVLQENLTNAQISPVPIEHDQDARVNTPQGAVSYWRVPGGLLRLDWSAAFQAYREGNETPLHGVLLSEELSLPPYARELAVCRTGPHTWSWHVQVARLVRHVVKALDRGPAKATALPSPQAADPPPGQHPPATL